MFRVKGGCRTHVGFLVKEKIKRNKMHLAIGGERLGQGGKEIIPYNRGTKRCVAPMCGVKNRHIWRYICVPEQSICLTADVQYGDVSGTLLYNGNIK